jgi:uncharacterized protein YbjT (DUF2867 family)
MEKNTKVILVTGATGKQGGAAVRHLLKDGWKVRALTRDASKPEAAELKTLGAEVVTGDLNDMASLENAMQGIYGVFSVQNFWEHGYEGELVQGKNLIDAAKKANVKHFLMTSVGGAERKTGLPHFDVKAEIEDHLKASGLNYTILRPVFFMENFNAWFKPTESEGKMVITMAMKNDTKLQLIAVDDIGVFARIVFDDPDKYLGKEIEIAGDELTIPQVADAYSKVTKVPTVFNELPMEILKQNSEEFAKMFQWFIDKGYEAKISELKAIHPGLKSFEQWLAGNSN